MTATAVISATTAGAGAVEIDLPAGSAFPVGGIAVDSSDAGSVKSTRASNMHSTGLRAVDGSSAATRGRWMVTTIRSGSVTVDGSLRNVDTSRAGSVKIGFTATQAVPATAGDNVNERAKVSRIVAAASAMALDLFDVAHCTAHGDKLRAFLAVTAGAAKIYARGAIGSRILSASLAILLVGIAVCGAAWI